ncbi:hypothetical protein SAMN02910456_02619 [Ruminococcaceae bacterium YRB3002]|nr:hypothetical protein SAMN02910456_02619 [Ruminococcaceae bacterium YRB3002]
MPLIEAKCTNCGGNLVFDDSKEKVFCTFCGTPFINEKTINNYQTNNNYNVGVVNIYGGGSINGLSDQNTGFGQTTLSISDHKYAAAFSKSEDQVKRELIYLLMNDKNAPLDVAFKTNFTSIKREYYPVAFIEVTCSAEWDATSIWEHEESYQVAREETVYIDYRGKEHKHSGSDTEYVNGRSINHYRRPMSRTVYDTKWRTITDAVQRTEGRVNPTTFTEIIWMGPESRKDMFFSWIDHVEHSQFLEVEHDYLKEYDVIKAEKEQLDAVDEAKEDARIDIGNVASRDVPGNRYEDMYVTSHVLSVNVVTHFLGVYHIDYEYSGKNYEYYSTGGTSSKDVIFGDHPTDSSLAQHANNIQKKINEANSIRMWPLVGIICFPLVALGVLGAEWSYIFAELGAKHPNTTILLITILIDSFLLAAAIGATMFSYLKYEAVDKVVDAAKKKKASYFSDNQKIKKQIYDLMENKTIPIETASASIEQLISNHFATYRDLDSLVYQKDKKENWKLIKKTLIVSFIILAILLVLGMILWAICLFIANRR